MAALSEPFASGDSVIHRMDPRIRLICAMLLTLPVALLTLPKPAWIAFAVGLFLVRAAHLNLILVMKRLFAVNFFIAFLWLFIPFSLPGNAIWSIGPLHATTQGVDLALLITVKSNAIVLGLMALLGTISIQNLGPAMQQLGIPNKLCHILLFTYRYIFAIHQEYTTMCQAMRARGFKPRTSAHTYRAYAWLVGMLLVKSWDRAERVQAAMRCRGFHGRFYSLTAFKSAPQDYLFLALCTCFCLGIIYFGFIQRGLS
ncbi:cobalt ECF transporter T component CbiQ [Pseudodesulfovibrio sp. S3]|uniref:cobalt ECF transporter T component CbiQ n=1 Tax=unclassified Pseudodesulfovibrio TaxID=2661612 RepID=UPI000FEB6CE4|nr:cobalt ECF transporter T component CbiQ [Pseudodesulfovibrio sp. S3]MCJ2163724.1 cobalt ECF transporter T component CbiQ [Pseudodesulfovibrio sp. S3-i]RWU06021.1 cobalt ECF transporter T component CbiQ [Pseudodesulfovibrio sp. S3]